MPDDPPTPVELQQQGREDPDLPADADDPTRPLAGESTDPEVHKLLADRDNARRNGDTDMITGIDARLAELGYYRQEPEGENQDG